MGRAGLDPAKFWRMTPYEIVKHIECEAERKKEQEAAIVQTAWLTEAMARTKKLPKLEKLLKEIDKPPRRQRTSTDAELIAAAKQKGLKGPWD